MKFVEHLKGMQFETVRIVGHTDPTGPKAMNERLSKRRAEVGQELPRVQRHRPQTHQDRRQGR